MFLAGGTCLLLIGRMEESERKLPLLVRVLAGAGIITLVELGVGFIANRDYRVGTIGICQVISGARSVPSSACCGFLVRLYSAMNREKPPPGK